MDATPTSSYHPDAMKTLLILISLLFTHSASACINVEGTNLHGEHRRTEGRFPAHQLQDAFLIEPADKLDQLLASQVQRPPGSAAEKEFHAVKELLSGNHDLAITLLQQLEAAHPDRYSTAANLGTAYELKDDLDSALKWIQEGIRRNPDSHHGSEWVHVEILKARIQLRENPRYLHDHRIIPIPDDLAENTTLSIGGHSYSPRQAYKAIFYQLQERMVFVKPPDPVVADLIFTLARIESHISTIDSARLLVSMSSTYELADPSIATREFERYNQAQAAASTRRTIRIILWSTAVLITIALGLYLAWRKRIFFLSSKSYRAHRAATHSP